MSTSIPSDEVAQGYTSTHAFTPCRRASAILSIAAVALPKFRAPDDLKCERTTGTPDSRPIRIVSSTLCIRLSPWLRRCEM